MSRDQRTARRVPVICPARIRTLDLGPSHYGTCTDLSVGGLTLQSSFVPKHDEELEVTVMPPRGANLAPQPMTARVRVRRCHEVERGVCYEIGVEIVEIVS
ncbi:PilZ domain-containing protein [Chitinimonas koreensis]|uniref:PilZ domain-containing protein n=1 Tax=Chitinimonas koreensis TaxID=356302 RepID=UPI00040FE16B|nr:PilZ domain-containing protein [Chitinimonas koreensis]QNM94961.1 PilZ domain-containing protein [Chitinimonas koreensis]